METSEVKLEEKCEGEPAKKPEEFVEFKKPIFVGKIGRLPRKINKDSSADTSSKDNGSKSDTESKETNSSSLNKLNLPPALLLKEKSIPLAYKEPAWSGLPPQKSGYFFEVIKSGTVLEAIDLTKKPFYVFGRLCVDDIVMAHPTISRHHAILQYKARETEDKRPVGFYLYDLGSSHGSFVNKVRIKPQHYARVRVGHLIKLGCSSRYYVLQGPEEDMEEESELSLTEMKQQKLAKRQEIEKEKQLAQLKEEEEKKKQEEDGISWGMADDAEEEPDLSENPFAVPSNEELYLDDPKKTLRGYFEREGVPLEYNCEERGVGQFVCRVELPMEDSNGRPLIAEVIHKGKKKDAVVQCALEACRIIDRHGLLRQAKHESHKRKTRDWKEDDFYDSDEDTFLDRTGAVERKRQDRIKKYGRHEETRDTKDNKALTYAELVDKCIVMEQEMEVMEKRLEGLRGCSRTGGSETEKADDEEDLLEQYMQGLSRQSVANKAEISKTKMEMHKLRKELNTMQRLAEIAKPAYLPALVSVTPESAFPETSKGPLIKKSSSSVIIGKRIKLKSREKTPYKKPVCSKTTDEEEFVEEVDSDEEDRTKKEVKRDADGQNLVNNDRLGGCSSLEDRNQNRSTKNVIVDKEIDQEDSRRIGDRIVVVESHKLKKGKESKLSKDGVGSDEDGSKSDETDEVKKVYGPMRPPVNYVLPEGYYDQENERDLPEITDESEY